MLTIDGSMGEGGGQILRTSLALSLVTGTAFRIEKVRAGRERPGLLRQHLTAVQAAAGIGQAEVQGDALGSRELVFRPGGILPGSHSFSVGTAGSTTLVLQTVLPALLVGTAPATLVLEGGTHNPGAPPFDFLEKAFLPLVNRLGPRVAVTLERAGFYPAGGGRFTVRVEPAPALGRLDLLERGEPLARRARAAVANLPIQIAQRELAVIGRKLSFDPGDLEAVEVRGSQGPGNIVTIEIASANVTEVFTGFGERGVRAEAVAEGVVQEARRYLAAGVPVGPHLADQLLIPLALAGGGSFRTVAPTRHFTTNAEVIRLFTGARVKVTPLGGDAHLVEVERPGA